MNAWEIRAQYTLQQSDQGCQLIEPTIQLDLRIVLPRWTSVARASSGLAVAWRHAQGQIISHEQQHRQHAHLAVSKAQAGLQELPAAAICPQAERQAQAVLRAANRQARQASLQFDLATDYVARNGISP
jgi:predicted secreted Zn-dependent protease